MYDIKTNIIKVYGKNIDSFFQNIITNDITRLGYDNSIYTAILSPQGKYLYDFIMIKNDQYILLETNENKVSGLIEEIKRYDLRSDINLSVEKNLVTKVVIKEELQENLFQKIKGKKLLREKNYTLFNDPRSEDFLYRFWINKEARILSKFKFSGEEKIEEKRIKLKIPNSNKDLTYNKSFILNYNFENINALSFNKGCYIGQENTARQKFRGTQKYSLKSIKIISGTMPDLNEDIFYKKMKIGTMKSKSNDIGLCLIRKDATKNNDEFLKADNNRILKIL